MRSSDLLTSSKSIEIWNVQRADEFCYSVTDGTHDSPKPQKNGRKLITSKHLKGNYVDFDSAKWISEEDYEKIIKRSSVDKWDILYSMIGTIGNIYLEKSDDIEYACKNMGIFKFKGDKAKAYWMYYYLKSPQAMQYIQSHQRGSTQSYVPLGTLRELPVLVPPDNVRDNIISILQSFDEKIEINNAINQNLEQQAKAIYNQMFINDSSTMGIEGTLSDIAVITMGQSPNGSSYNEEGNGTVFFQGRTDFGSRFPMIRLYTTEPKRMAEKNDVLMSVRAPVGDINIAHENCCIGRGLGAIHSKDNHQSFVLYTMFALRPQLEIFNGEGTVFGSINRDALNSMPVLIPSKDKMDNFEEIVEPMDATILANYDEICRLQQIRDTLLPRLMSGQLDVSAINI